MAFQRPSSPPWSTQPSNQWSILEIKSGVEIAEHNLTVKSKRPNSRIIVIGRAADQVDIEMQHESISRFHARIAFDKEGETPWIRDLSSTHGVFVNKRLLPAITIGREESMSTTAGSRGVILYPDDIIQFGASSRLFCVVGPHEFSRMKEIHGKSYESTGMTTLQNNLVLDSFDAFSNNEDNDDNGAFLSDEKIPESLRPEWEKLKALQFKMENIGNESERIQMKGDIDTLSTGQAKQLERNNERITALKEQIYMRESELYRKIDSNSSDVHRISKKTKAELHDDDDDCVFDRTRADNETFVEINEGGETAETLMAKWIDLHKEVDEVASKLIILGQKETRLEQKLNADGDVFFIENDLNLVRETKQKLQQAHVVLLKHLGEIEEMINVANPKLRKSSDGLSWSDPTSISEKETTDSSVEVSTHSPMEKHKLSFSEKASEQPQHQSTMNPLSKRQKRSNVAGTSGTVALLAKAKKSFNKQQQEEQVVLESNVRPVKSEANHNIEVLNEGQHDHWQAPKDQDGSGKTKLNAKFAGRY